MNEYFCGEPISKARIFECQSKLIDAGFEEEAEF
jgi:hypothetical protein